MNYSELNIYNKDKFILRSETRQRQFPFIKFNGSNYEEVKSFLSVYAPNIIIEPQSLKIGEIYSIYGKDYSLLRIPYDELRCVIASNPYLVSEEGIIPLALDYQHAQEYLKENRHHKLFAFENPLATYKYNPEHSAFMMYDYSHPLGLTFNSLNERYEWYICGDDGANRKWYGQRIEINTVLHTICIRPDFGGLVYRIGRIIMAINKNLAIQGRPAQFASSWEIQEWKESLKKRCLKEDHFRSFVDTLYYTVFDNNRGDRTGPLGDIEDKPFAKFIEGLHDYYVFGREYKEVPVAQIFSNYLNNNQGPQEPNDYTKLQEGILKDFYDYLIKILESVKKDFTIVGTICEDEQGNLYCGKALLSQDLYVYRGCKCKITSLIKNPDEKTAGNYPYYCEKLNSVTLNRSGTINKDEEGTFYLDSYIIKEDVSDQLGEEAQLKQIHPFLKPRGKYLGEVSDYALLKELTKDKGLSSMAPMTFPLSSRPGRHEEHWLVDKYANIPNIDDKVCMILKTKVWKTLYKEVCLLKFPADFKPSSRTLLCASLIFHAAEKSGIAIVETVKMEKKGSQYEESHSTEDLFNVRDDSPLEKDRLKSVVIQQGLTIREGGVGLAKEGEKTKWAKHFPYSYKKTLELMGYKVSQGAPANYLKMLNYWLPEYNKLILTRSQAQNDSKRLEMDAKILLFLEKCKNRIKTHKDLMEGNHEPLTIILERLEQKLPKYFAAIR